MFDDKITVKDNKILDFLHDYESNVEVIVLEESKQRKNELIQIAKAKGILVEGSFDLAVIKMVYVFPDKANGNRVRVPKDELLKRLPTLIGKPLNLDHIRRYTIGYFIDYRYIEKENKVIAYAIFFKEIFKDEWKQLVKLIKQKKLTNSYEIWSDKKLTEENSDGTKTLHNLQIGGGAIIWKEKPAFKEAYVLEEAKKQLENPKEMELIYACLNKEGFCSLNSCNAELVIAGQEGLQTIPVQKPNTPMKIVCSNCGRNFEYNFIPGQTNAQIKCTNCFAILDSTGKMIYPPQLRNFNLSCPECRNTNNWLILSKNNKEDIARIKCLSCSKEYNIKFKAEGIKSHIIKKLTFLRTGVVPCIQCGRRNDFAVPSTQPIVHIKCKKCGLQYTFDVGHKTVRVIESYEEVKMDKKESKSLKEDNKMEKVEIKARGLNTSSFKKLLRKAVSKIRTSRKEAELSKAKVEKFVGGIKKFANKVRDSKKEVELVKANLDSTNSKIKKFVGGIRKFANKIRGLKGKVKGYELEVASLKGKVEETKKFYLENAKKIVERRNELTDSELTDEQILNDKDFELAVAKQQLAEKDAEEKKESKKLETADLHIGDKTHGEDYYKKFRKGVNKVAFDKKK